ncbi:glycosyltransferase [Liquorilactobacillus hordei]|uniref:glycosyltransferase n=1 Tax=Liquorilactobacillus hordei TaxID=468911 RepID=UPI0039E86067
MGEKIKILNFELANKFGGIESFLLNVYTKMNKDSIHCDFIASSNDRIHFYDKFIELGAEVYYMPNLRSISAYVRRLNTILDTGYDIVHFHKNSAANIIPILIVKNHPSNPKIIIHSHNTAASTGNFLTSMLHKVNKLYMEKIADKKIACSSVASEWMFLKKDVEIVNNGIDTHKFKYNEEIRNRIRKTLEVNPEEILIGHIGRFTKQKNQSFLIDIFKEIKDIKKDSKLILVGDGPLLKEIMKKVRLLNLEDSVIFFGTTDKVSELLNAIDILIMPSLYEGLAVSAVEAQSVGVITYISNNCSKETKLTDQTFFFDLNDSSKKIAKDVLNNFQKLLGEYAKDSASYEVKKKGYDLSNTVQKLELVYKDILK